MTINKEKTVLKSIPIGAKCDVCGKLIYLRSEYPQCNTESKQFYNITTGHNDWGNDSVESVSNYQVCCGACAEALLQLFFDRAEDPKDWMNTEYFHIEHSSSYSCLEEELRYERTE